MSNIQDTNSMTFKPKGSALKAYENGREARRRHKLLSDNPNQYGPKQILASWWDKGWYDENKESTQIMID